MTENAGAVLSSRRSTRSLPVGAVLAVSALLPAATAVPAQAVVGGTAATRGQFPSIVSIERGAGHACAGTLIAAGRVLTAAQCVDGVTAGGLRVVAGRHHLSGTTPPSAERRGRADRPAQRLPRRHPRR
ncbi:trypsin-like serine protease [Streptomyces subrutilus]|uniref:trypsin-like serine protease n=1 Tax=Streptomyces subrutilus TaxID=36818 RepID=UPI0033D99F37